MTNRASGACVSNKGLCGHLPPKFSLNLSKGLQILKLKRSKGLKSLYFTITLQKLSRDPRTQCRGVILFSLFHVCCFGVCPAPTGTLHTPISPKIFSDVIWVRGAMPQSFGWPKYRSTPTFPYAKIQGITRVAFFVNFCSCV